MVYYTIDQLDVQKLKALAKPTLLKNDGMCQYWNIPASFDIETSSWFENNAKRATMYVWQLAIDNIIIVGRTWSEFLTMMQIIEQVFSTWAKRRFVIYVHNLEYEMGFIRGLLDWDVDATFSMDERRFLYATTTGGVQFRCSYLLSAVKESLLGDELQNPIKKLVGNLDYNKIRHSRTPLTNDEIDYCINDVRIVVQYIREQIQACGDITKIPYTKTGFVRKYARQACLYSDNKKANKAYKFLIKNLTLDVNEYAQLKRAFCGGFTHANYLRVQRVIDDVTSFDFTSSYPTVLVAEKFPMSRGRRVDVTDVNEVENLTRSYCVLMDVEYTNIQQNMYVVDNPISSSRCIELVNADVNNGRVAYADRLKTTVTDVDYDIIKHFYVYDDVKISNVIIYDKGYLPKQFIKCVFDFYVKKTQYKTVKGKEMEYAQNKSMLNSLYGMLVMDICRDEIGFDGINWTSKKPDYLKQIEKYNTDPKRFTFYPWGVWCTAYARRNLFDGILACGGDYIYADTDSVKIANADKHANYFENYNSRIISKLENACKFHKIPTDAIRPKDVNGKERPLGIWDFDGFYSHFKTIGAKRYLTQKTDGSFGLTVAGLNKEKACEYIASQPDPWAFFDDGMVIPPEHTGKLTHTYIDEPTQGVVTDYLGQTCEYAERTSIHMMGAEYNMGIGAEYADFLLGIYTREK